MMEQGTSIDRLRSNYQILHTLARNSLHAMARNVPRTDLHLRAKPVVLVTRKGCKRQFNLETEETLRSEIARITGKPVTIFHGNESVQETIFLFRRAKIVVGYHGAGIANIIFSTGQTLVVELTTSIDSNLADDVGNSRFQVVSDNFNVNVWRMNCPQLQNRMVCTEESCPKCAAHVIPLRQILQANAFDADHECEASCKGRLWKFTKLFTPAAAPSNEMSLREEYKLLPPSCHTYLKSNKSDSRVVCWKDVKTGNGYTNDIIQNLPYVALNEADYSAIKTGIQQYLDARLSTRPGSIESKGERNHRWKARKSRLKGSPSVQQPRQHV